MTGTRITPRNTVVDGGVSILFEELAKVLLVAMTGFGVLYLFQT